MRRTFLALPTYGPLEPETALAIADAARRETVLPRVERISLLAHSFNRLWCQCLNARRMRGFTHFAMLHADVAPQTGWLNLLLNELDRTGADVLGAVIPIKDDKGLTSCAAFNGCTENIRTLSAREVARYPATFDSHSLREGERLLINTGLWVCRLGDWCEEVWFEILDRIERDEHGRLVPRVLSEDWNFSIRAHRAGARICATRMLQVKHFGRAAYEYRFEEATENAESTEEARCVSEVSQ